MPSGFSSTYAERCFFSASRTHNDSFAGKPSETGLIRSTCQTTASVVSKGTVAPTQCTYSGVTKILIWIWPYGVSTVPEITQSSPKHSTDSLHISFQSRRTSYNRGVEEADGWHLLIILYAVSLPAHKAQVMVSGVVELNICFCSLRVKTRLTNRRFRLFPLLCGSVRSTMSLPMCSKIRFLHICQFFDNLLRVEPLCPEAVFFCVLQL